MSRRSKLFIMLSLIVILIQIQMVSIVFANADTKNIVSTDNDIKVNRFIIKYKDENAREKFNNSFNGKHAKSLKGKIKENSYFGVFTPDKEISLKDLKEEIQSKQLDNCVEYVQPDYELKLSSNDPLYNKQWGIDNSAQDIMQDENSFKINNNILDKLLSKYKETAKNQVFIDFVKKTPWNELKDKLLSDDAPGKVSKAVRMKLADDLKLTLGNPNIIPFKYSDAGLSGVEYKTTDCGVKVVIIDTGVDINHEDLKDNIWINENEIAGNGIDDDGNGYIDDVNGWNFYSDNNVIYDENNPINEMHGTHVAGIISAEKDNNIGITGVAPSAEIVPLKVFQNGKAFTSDIIAAIKYAGSIGAKIVNCSWGSPEYNQALHDTIQNSGMLFICASGNEGKNIDVNPVYPASFDCPNIITVASLNRYGKLSGFSNYGVNNVDVAAPGESIISTLPGNKYGVLNGTSIASAFVSGEAALLYMKNDNEDINKVKSSIINTSDRLSSLADKVNGGFKINCYNSLNEIINQEVMQVPIYSYSSASSTIYDSSDYSLYSSDEWILQDYFTTYDWGHYYSIAYLDIICEISDGKIYIWDDYFGMLCDYHEYDYDSSKSYKIEVCDYGDSYMNSNGQALNYVELVEGQLSSINITNPSVGSILGLQAVSIYSKPIASGKVETPSFSPAAGTYTGTQNVTITSGTAGSTIYYTTDGTTPTTGSTVYSTSVSVTASNTIKAIAVKNGMADSDVASAAYTILAKVATPTFSPAAGAYTGTQSVIISNATAGSTIYYTTNGTNPTTASTVYSAPITISSSCTIKAMAAKSGMTNSDVASAAYTIMDKVAAPTFSPAAGTYTGAQGVTISSATAGSTIYYTTNGTNPTTASTVYSAPITISSSCTIKAMAAKSGMTNSDVASAAYTIMHKVAPPTFSPATGTYIGTQSVTITSATAGSTIYYTTNGTIPTTASAVYSSPVLVATSGTIKAMAVKNGMLNSDVGSAAFTIQSYEWALVGSLYTYGLSNYDLGYLNIFGEIRDGKVYVWDDYLDTVRDVCELDYSPGAVYKIEVVNLDPDYAYMNSNGEALNYVELAEGQISGIEITNPTLSGFVLGGQTVKIYIKTAIKSVGTPSFSPAAGTYIGTQSVTISSVTAESTIFYTTDGTMPTTASTVYTAPITVSVNSTIKAVAIKSGMGNSDVASSAYTILQKVATPEFSPAAGTYTTQPAITISSSTDGATIYYTTNGTTPTTSSAVYTAPIMVIASNTIKAMAVKSGMADSNVASAIYRIKDPPSTTVNVYCSDGKIVNYVITGLNIKNLDQRVFTVNYDPNALEVLDLSMRTQVKETDAENIIGANIDIIEFDKVSGKIKFKYNKTVSNGMTWSGTVNTIQFKCRMATGTTLIQYSVN